MAFSWFCGWRRKGTISRFPAGASAGHLFVRARCRARASTKRTHNLITDLPLHIPKKVKNLAVRRELVFDECVGASRLRRQAHVFFHSTNRLNSLTLCQLTEANRADCFLRIWLQKKQNDDITCACLDTSGVAPLRRDRHTSFYKTNLTTEPDKAKTNPTYG